jgi:hypothetical protein
MIYIRLRSQNNQEAIVKLFLLLSVLILINGLDVSSQVKGQTVNVIEAAAPGYPLAWEGSESAEVRVEIIITPEGLVSSAKAYTGPAQLQRAAEAAALKWKFAKQDNTLTHELVFAFIHGVEIKDPPEVSVVYKLPNRIEIFTRERIRVMRPPPARMVEQD